MGVRLGALVASGVGSAVETEASDGDAVAAGCDPAGLGDVAAVVEPHADVSPTAAQISNGYPSLRRRFTDLTLVEQVRRRLGSANPAKIPPGTELSFGYPRSIHAVLTALIRTTSNASVVAPRGAADYPTGHA